MANNDIVDHFDQYFEMVPATSDELKSEVYKLRYQVYCIENAFLNSKDYHNNLEIDDYDEQSIHYLIRHRKSGDYAGTTRLILPDANNPEKFFPLELHCEIDNFTVIQPIDRKHIGEVSRFCVSKAFKKRRNEANSIAALTNGSNLQNHFTLAEQRSFPHISIALMACAIKASYENNIHFLYATTEPAWLRFLSALGINFIKIGPLIDYHGARWPTLIRITDLLDGVAEKNLDIWNLLTNKGSIWQARPRPIIEKRADPMAQYKSRRTKKQ